MEKFSSMRYFLKGKGKIGSRRAEIPCIQSRRVTNRSMSTCTGFLSQGGAKLRAQERECSKECACLIREMGKHE